MDPKHYARLSAREIASGVRAKKFSALEVTEAALERAHALDPQIKAFVTILDDMASQAAKEVDAAIRAAIDVYRELGAETIEVSMPRTEYAVAVYYIVATAGASSNLARDDELGLLRLALAYQSRTQHHLARPKIAALE